MPRRRTRGWRGAPSSSASHSLPLPMLIEHLNHLHRVQVCVEKQPKEAAISTTGAKRRPGGEAKGEEENSDDKEKNEIDV